MALNEEPGGFDIQLFGDVFADQGQRRSAVATLAGIGFVAVFDARQMRRQGLATGARPFGAGHRRAWGFGEGLDLRLNRRLVLVPGVVE